MDAQHQYSDLAASNRLGDVALKLLTTAVAVEDLLCMQLGPKLALLNVELAEYENAVQGILLSRRAASIKSAAFAAKDLLLQNDVRGPISGMVISGIQSSGLCLQTSLSLYPWVHVEYSKTFYATKSKQQLRKALGNTLRETLGITEWKPE